MTKNVAVIILNWNGEKLLREFLGSVVENTNPDIADVVVADNDGVIVVPRKVAYDVAKYAWQEMNGDKAARQQLYKELGWELDDTVIPVEEKK